MHLESIVGTVLILSLQPPASPASPQPSPPKVMYMEPAEAAENGELTTYNLVTDTKRLETYNGWLENESARLAFDLYDRAWATVQRRVKTQSAPPPYHIALVPGGNHVAGGFRLRSDSGATDHPKLAYIKLGPQEWRFGNTLLHETGHIVLSVLAGGEGVPARAMSSIPHTTSALTNRGTAFNEGFSIYLEAMDAHLNNAPEMRNQYRHERFEFGSDGVKRSEYYRHGADMATYSQTIARYYEVRENNFAFAPAFKGPEYLRVQLEKARDFSTLLNANQLLQSEGFYASFFFAYTFRGEGMPTTQTVRDRQDKMLASLAEMFASRSPDSEAPFLLYFVETFMHLYPSDAAEMVDVLTDLSHGVFVDAEAATLWRDFYFAALNLDVRNLPTERINKARRGWREAVLKDPKVLYSRLGPQIACEVSEKTVKLVAFGREIPLSFDVNTVQEGIMRMIPGITDEEVSRWLSQRAIKPFASADDFKQRAQLSEHVLGSMKL